ncbi:MAG: transcription-repair coupling factor [Candidatus Omnitrophica bacterium]|nr:transcription-repair coupling factor [Candidatus Omnitrophota bacterium]
MIESLKLYLNEISEIDEVVSRLNGLGYNRCRKVSIEGDFSVVGESLTLFPVTFEYPVRIDLFGSRVRSIKSVDLYTFKTITEHKGVIVLPAGALRKKRLKRPDTGLGEQPINSFVDIEPGDHVVHIDYGIGKYIGIQKMGKGGASTDHFVLEYSSGDRLYVPPDDLHKLQRYVSFHRKVPRLNSLKAKGWDRTKQSASRGAAGIARDLLDLQARREASPGYAFSKDTDWQEEVEEAFPYKETPDQLKATRAVKEDMEKRKPMDRLLCGDVGYGKTEVALRAAFKAVMDNKQVAFLVPTTILAEQHTETFTKRLEGYPVNIQMLNRFRTQSEQENVLSGLRGGKVDVVIGTHRLLSGDVEFHDLGLLIIDEEQRFGVAHKDRIKRMRVNVDILTLTATPIPRTLYLALMGGKDISVIETPPLERLPVHTEVLEYDKKVIREALRHELDRGGQVYYVHNRVENIEKVALSVKKLVPEARVRIGHGQMSSRALEETMFSFIKGEVDVLVCTTIVESGIDIPNANTMVVNNADNFGLADLYQLRGRIGRFDKKAFAYLVVRDSSSLTHEVQARFRAIKKYQELGSGFKIAMHDLEMRGAGNLLGTRQSGFIDQVGFDLYCRLLKAEIGKLQEDKR